MNELKYERVSYAELIVVWIPNYIGLNKNYFGLKKIKIILYFNENFSDNLI